MWASIPELVAHARPEDVHRELLAQIVKVKATGLRITHLDAHMVFWRASKPLMQIYLNLPKETGIPVVSQLYEMPFDRQMKLNSNGMKQNRLVTPDTYTMLYNPAKRSAGERYAGYDLVIHSLPAAVNHITIHPAEDSADAQKRIANMQLRLSDFQVWDDIVIHDLIAQEDIKTTNCEGMLSLQEKINSNKQSCPFLLD